jgi:hypothetical protein
MVKKANVAEDEPISLKWSWRPEMDDKTILLGKGDVTINQILDQKEAANDLSDYLFYMTRSFFDVYVLVFCFNTLFIILLEVYLVNFFYLTV